MDDVIRAIEEALERKGMSAAAASNAAVGNPALIKNLKNRRAGKQAHPYENLRALADVLGLELYFGPKRQGLSYPSVSIGEGSNSDYALIRTTLVEAAAGTGTYVDRVEDTEPLAFRKDWLSRIGVAADKAILLRAKGHSMQPLIWDGDMLLIDTSKTSPRIRPRGRSFPGGPQDEIFVLRMDDDVRVKAIKRPAEDQVMIYSENRDRFDPEILTGAQLNDLVIIGKVVWYGHVTS